MSKELEALNYLTDAASRYARAPLQYSDMYKTVKQAIDELEALRRYHEPMKPIKGKEDHRCPKCAHIVDNHYCSDCGQKLDWSDEK